ncbi:hypothetical protein GOARA_061_00990 [Gordonia araii NBRC 100433]|uniref:Rv2525c-like glycoside hydrolase-like domain-containing protein n=1 Tax=Gordonia araii NBRC 100433 TaxID=1073574 RepID=G7H485_9ACTN|nr:DUF1906 domain-containing protein [Gordonia araii]NNG96281.1 DUF1906 domain-containing protein [Gordonia araii NBRC 100433]GAB10660.1 hypothetical protein GOARA_061_00990 [Gordonia araii NBRC 100433]
MPISRRQFFSAAAVAGVFAVATTVPAGTAVALPPSLPGGTSLGTILDYSSRVPSPVAIRTAGHVGVIRYVSDRRPGAEKMLAKPLTLPESLAMRGLGLTVVSNYQYGKGKTADWLGGFDAGVKHARRAVELHTQAGGPGDAPIYASIDDNPSRAQFTSRIAPYIKGWQSVIGKQRTGIYANAPTIQWAVDAGLASWFWQHDWGTRRGYLHPAAHLHQIPGQRRVGGVEVDVNTILKPRYGQWAGSGSS